jgi:LPXTG-motif cell wall-anchored protein
VGKEAIKVSGSHSGARHLRYRIAAFIFSLLVSAGAFAAQISGTVTNATTNKPSSGDEVTLLSLTSGMQEVASTKTDSQGHYTLNVPDDGAQHLVRVARQSVHYFQAAPPGTTTVDITVYDAATQVEGLVTDARVFHLQASDASLEVRDEYIVNNRSQPPRTKIGNQTFAVTLPDGAEMGEASLTGPSGMPVTVAAVPSGAKNRYAYDFPIRPGETRFEVTYKLPYSGSHEFSIKPEAPLSELGVLLPKSMKFNGVSGSFAQDVDEAGLAVFFVKNVPANQEIKFSVSGEGLIPTEPPGGSPSQPAESASAPIPNPSSGTSGVLWFVVAGIVILIGGGAFFMWRKNVPAKTTRDSKLAKASSKARVQAQSQAAKPQQGDILNVLKDELFQLETDHVSGKISQEEYEKSKAGLDTLFRRQMKNSKSAK